MSFLTVKFTVQFTSDALPLLFQRGLPTREHVEEHRRAEVRVQQLADPDAAATLPTAYRHIRICSDLKREKERGKPVIHYVCD